MFSTKVTPRSNKVNLITSNFPNSSWLFQRITKSTNLWRHNNFKTFPKSQKYSTPKLWSKHFLQLVFFHLLLLKSQFRIFSDHQILRIIKWLPVYQKSLARNRSLTTKEKKISIQIWSLPSTPRCLILVIIFPRSSAKDLQRTCLLQLKRILTTYWIK